MRGDTKRRDDPTVTARVTGVSRRGRSRPPPSCSSEALGDLAGRLQHAPGRPRRPPCCLAERRDRHDPRRDRRVGQRVDASPSPSRPRGPARPRPRRGRSVSNRQPRRSARRTTGVPARRSRRPVRPSECDDARERRGRASGRRGASLRGIDRDLGAGRPRPSRPRQRPTAHRPRLARAASSCARAPRSAALARVTSAFGGPLLVVRRGVRQRVAVGVGDGDRGLGLVDARAAAAIDVRIRLADRRRRPGRRRLAPPRAPPAPPRDRSRASRSSRRRSGAPAATCVALRHRAPRRPSRRAPGAVSSARADRHDARVGGHGRRRGDRRDRRRGPTPPGTGPPAGAKNTDPGDRDDQERDEDQQAAHRGDGHLGGERGRRSFVRQDLADREPAGPPRRQQAGERREDEDDRDPDERPLDRVAYASGRRMNTLPSASASSLLMGSATSAPVAHESAPISMPSVRKIRSTAPSDAPTARRTPISRARSTTLMVIVPVRPSPPTTPSRMRHRRQEQDEHVEQRLLGLPELGGGRGRGDVHAHAPRGASGRRAPARPAPSAIQPGRAHDHQHARPPDLVASSRSSAVSRRVEERPLGGRLRRCPTSVHVRVLAVDPQRDRVADAQVRLVVAEVRGRDQGVAVVGQEPATLLDRRPDGLRVGRQPERERRRGPPRRPRGRTSWRRTATAPRR